MRKVFVSDGNLYNIIETRAKIKFKTTNIFRKRMERTGATSLVWCHVNGSDTINRGFQFPDGHVELDTAA